MEETEHWASNQVSACKADYEKKRSILSDREFELEGKLRRADDLVDYREEYIESESDKRAAKITAKIKEEYKQKSEKIMEQYETKKAAIYGFLILMIVYGFLTTAYQAIRSERFWADFIEFWKTIALYIYNRWLDFEVVMECVSSITADIPYAIVRVIVAIILLIIALLIMIAIFLLFPLTPVVIIGYLYKKCLWDLVSVGVAIMSFAFIVWIADHLNSVSWNLLLVWILIQAIYALIRVIKEYWPLYCCS